MPGPTERTDHLGRELDLARPRPRVFDYRSVCGAEDPGRSAEQLDFALVLHCPLRVEDRAHVVDRVPGERLAGLAVQVRRHEVERHPDTAAPHPARNEALPDGAEPGGLLQLLDPRLGRGTLDVAPREEERLRARDHDEVARLGGAREIEDVAVIGDDGRHEAGSPEGLAEPLESRGPPHVRRR